MKKYAVVVAGGFGKRMGNIIPKQFLLLKGRPLLWYTIDSFLRAYDEIEIILVLPKDHLIKGEKIAVQLKSDKIKLVAGGVTRFDSVKGGLKLVKEESVVFVHDGVRCLISVPLIKRCYNQAVEKGSAIPAVATTDSICTLTNRSPFAAASAPLRLAEPPPT